MRKNNHTFLSSFFDFDKPLLFCVLTLVLFGIVMVANASVVDAVRTFNDELFFAKRQLVRAIGGLFIMFLISKIPHKILIKLSAPLMVISIILLILVLIPGFGTHALGARRWINLSFIDLQPAEFAKFSLCLYFASLFQKTKSVLPFLAIVALVVGLVLLQPDMSTAIIIVLFSAIVYFISGANLAYFLAMIPMGAILALLLILTSSYRKERLMTFLTPSIDPQGASYHIRQILITLGSGGLFGLGLGQSRQKYLYLPEPATDSIFAIIGEELGFIGGALVVCLFMFFIWRGLMIAKNAVNESAKILAVGLTAWIGIQAFMNISAMVALIPLTGIPLPFISYGGTALILNLATVGILLNISRKDK